MNEEDYEVDDHKKSVSFRLRIFPKEEEVDFVFSQEFCLSSDLIVHVWNGLNLKSKWKERVASECAFVLLHEALPVHRPSSSTWVCLSRILSNLFLTLPPSNVSQGSCQVRKTTVHCRNDCSATDLLQMYI